MSIKYYKWKRGASSSEGEFLYEVDRENFKATKYFCGKKYLLTSAAEARLCLQISADKYFYKEITRKEFNNLLLVEKLVK